jgi:hypothetical protein
MFVLYENPLSYALKSWAILCMGETLQQDLSLKKIYIDVGKYRR